MRIIGERLMVTRELELKSALEIIVAKVTEVPKDGYGRWFNDIQDETQAFFSEYKDKDSRLLNLDIDEDFVNLDPKNRLKIIVWFMMWLAKVVVKIEFLLELCIIFSKIWKVLFESQLDIQDLDNKLVWKKVTKESKDVIPRPVLF